jgi:hypothetical protein
MTATQTQIRRGTAAQCAGMTPASSEVIHDTTNNRLRAGDGSRAGGWELPNFSDIQKQAFQAGTVGGSANAITMTNAVAVIAYASNLKLVFKATAANTGATTVNVDGLGVKNIYKIKDGSLTALEAGDIINGGVYEIIYDGTQFQIKGLNESSGGSVGWDLLAVVTGGGAVYDFLADVITSEYANYAFVLQNVLPATDSGSLQVRMRRSGEANFDTSGYAWNAFTSTSSAGATSGSDSDSRVTLIGTVRNSANAGIGVSGVLYGHNFGLSGYSQVVADVQRGMTNAAGARSMAGGVLQNTSALDGLQFIFSSGNIASGTVRAYGIRSTI